MKQNNGWLLVDKHIGVTSREIVNKISKCLTERKVGHAGTLDPMASGLLAVAVGEATKSIFVMQNMIKVYEFKVRWGFSTTTDDIEGSVLSVSSIRPTKNEIAKSLPELIGNIKQIPPNFSAIKINGVRSYKLARQNKEIDHKPRVVKIHDLKYKKYINKNYSVFEVICSKGTFVRSIARDLGKKLNTEAHVVELRRKSIGKFSVKNAILLDLSQKLIHSPLILKNLIPMRDVLKALPSINLTKDEAYKIKNGQKLSVNDVKYFNEFLKDYPNYNQIEDLYCCVNDVPIAFLKIENNKIRPLRVFNV